MADREFILSPIQVPYTFRVEQASTLMNSLHLMTMSEYSSGLDQWIYDTVGALSDEEWLRHNIVTNVGFEEYVEFHPTMTFLDYVEAIKSIEPEIIAQASIEWMNKHDELPSPQEATHDEDTYVEVMRRWYANKSDTKGLDIPFDERQWRMMYQFMQTPDELKALVLDHLTMMWERFLQPEWQKRQPLLTESLNAYLQMDYAGLSPYEVIEAVTGRDLRGKEFFSKVIQSSNEIVFIPSPHLGPYIGYDDGRKEPCLRFFFGARLPKGSAVKSTALSRSELLVWLNALADDTRLRMMELLVEHEELCAQDFINLLDLSQSSASRHLRQLTASGYVQERRREVAKCYRLNTDRIEDTVSALRQLLVAKS